MQDLKCLQNKCNNPTTELNEHHRYMKGPYIWSTKWSNQIIQVQKTFVSAFKILFGSQELVLQWSENPEQIKAYYIY